MLATQCKAVELSLVALIVLLLGSSQQVMQGVLAKNDLIIVVLIMLGSGFALELNHFLYHSRLNMKAASPSASLIANQLLVFGIAYSSSSYGPIVGVSLCGRFAFGWPSHWHLLCIGGLPGCKAKPEGLGKGAAIEEADWLALHWQHQPGRSAVYGLHR
ncbi:MAG: hypothetical protein NT053_05525 [Cyanobacteria bacterium]|nr:hypothetical protein [Cyanobacteriota bacterium]